MFLLLINILLLVLGTFMDLAPMLLICTPIFLPVVKMFGIDPVHFGMIMILNLGIGLLTPPVGPTLVVGCAIGKVTMEAVSKSIMIFYIPMLIVLVLVTYIPALSLWLPSLLLGRVKSARFWRALVIADRETLTSSRTCARSRAVRPDLPAPIA